MNLILRASLKPYPEISLPEVLAASASRFRDKIAAVHGSRTATFEELNARSTAIALGLAELNVQSGQLSFTGLQRTGILSSCGDPDEHMR